MKTPDWSRSPDCKSHLGGRIGAFVIRVVKTGLGADKAGVSDLRFFNAGIPPPPIHQVQMYRVQHP